MYHMLNSYVESAGIEVNDQRKRLQQMDPRAYLRGTAPNDCAGTGFDHSQLDQAIILQQHPAITLLQQKFKQLERSKEMRSKQLQHQRALSEFSSTLSLLSVEQQHIVQDSPTVFRTLTSNGSPDWNYLFSNQQPMQRTSTDCVRNSYNTVRTDTVSQFNHGLPSFVQSRSMVSSGSKGDSPVFCRDPRARRTSSGHSPVSSGYLQSTEGESGMQPPEDLHHKQFISAAPERRSSSNSSTSQFSFEHPLSDDSIISLEEESTSALLWPNQSVESEVETALSLGNCYKIGCSAFTQRKVLLDPCSTVSRDTFSGEIDTTLHL